MGSNQSLSKIPFDLDIVNNKCGTCNCSIQYKKKNDSTTIPICIKCNCCIICFNYIFDINQVYKSGDFCKIKNKYLHRKCLPKYRICKLFYCCKKKTDETMEANIELLQPFINEHREYDAYCEYDAYDAYDEHREYDAYDAYGEYDAYDAYDEHCEYHEYDEHREYDESAFQCDSIELNENELNENELNEREYDESDEYKSAFQCDSIELNENELNENELNENELNEREYDESDEYKSAFQCDSIELNEHE
jgi:hypothetical protein